MSAAFVITYRSQITTAYKNFTRKEAGETRYKNINHTSFITVTSLKKRIYFRLKDICYKITQFEEIALKKPLDKHQSE